MRFRDAYEIHSQILVDVGSWTEEQKKDYDRRYWDYMGENGRAYREHETMRENEKKEKRNSGWRRHFI